MTKRSSLRLSITLFLLFLASAVTLGAMRARTSYLLRGIPDGLPQPISHAGVKLGLNVYLDGLDEFELKEQLAQIASSGVQIVKQPFYYQPYSPWLASDRLVAAIRDAQLQLVPLLDGNPDNGFAPPQDIDEFATWAGEFAHRYGELVDYYIIWDEPNLASHWGDQDVNPDAYGALLSASAEAIRQADQKAFIVASPLAPTVETGPRNLSDAMFLQALYEAGAESAFDIVSGKPYGFNLGPENREVELDLLNFSHIILLREVMVANGDEGKAIWAGNWGWNALPGDWQGAASIWGQTDEDQQATWTIAALERATKEWPWMGHMFLENWQPNAPADDPRWGFSIAGRDLSEQLKTVGQDQAVAWPGFHLAQEGDLAQSYTGGWRFSPSYGADISQSGDTAQLRFWGTDIGLRVRRANYRARLYVTVDGQPANGLPKDDRGSFLILDAPSPSQDYLTVESVARDLAPGEHILEIEALRGWDQWAINGYSVAYRPDSDNQYVIITFGLLSMLSLFGALYIGLGTDWSGLYDQLSGRLDGLKRPLQLGLVGLASGIVAITGWLTWGQHAAGIYRRLGDSSQVAITAAAATLFYIAPSLLVYTLALATLLFLIAIRPVWGLAVVAFSIPFYVKPKPMLGYQFSPVEVFLLTTVAATVLVWFLQTGRVNKRIRSLSDILHRFGRVDWAVLVFVIVATLSLFFTERLDVATNEWRVLILEPALFYFLLTAVKMEREDYWHIIDAFVIGGIVVALIGLGQLISGQNLITSEGGLMRIRSIFGSPNNVALYLGRIIPLTVIVTLMGNGRRRLVYALGSVILGLAILFTFSKGALFLGVPAAFIVIFVLWRRRLGGRIWPWLAGLAATMSLGLFVLSQFPQLAERLNPQGSTGFFRLNLWRSSLEMIKEHPIFGVGLDNFLYAYRGRYIMDAAWQEPNLNHPHNIFLDLLTRLGIAGFAAGVWLLILFFKQGRELLRRSTDTMENMLASAFLATLAYILFHGLVDHSIFLVDLSYAFFLMLGLGRSLIADRPPQP